MTLQALMHCGYQRLQKTALDQASFFVFWSTQPLYKSYLSMSHSVEGRKGFFVDVQLFLGEDQQLVELALLLP